MVSIFIVVLFYFQANAGFTYLHRKIGSTPLYWRYVAVTPEDAVTGNMNPYLKLTVDLVLDPPDKVPDTEFILFHYQNYNTKIKQIDGEWCCTQKLYDNDECNTVGTLILDGIGNWTDHNDTYQVDDTQTIVYWTNLNGYSYDPEFALAHIEDTILLNKTGVWYFFMVQCNDTHKVDVSGILEWKNPYGYLSAVLFPFLPMYLCLSIAFFILGTAWVYFLVKYRTNIMGLQHVITATLTIALAENILWSCDYINYNFEGKISDVTNMIGALLTSGKLTIIRTLILLVSLGYSINIPNLENKTKLYVALITIIYGISNTIQEYIWVIKTMGLEFPFSLEVITGLTLVLINFFYVGWVGFSLHHQWNTLSGSKQTEKLSMYKKFIGFLVVFLIISGVLYFCQIAFLTLNLRDDFWRVWWLWDAYWECGYFLVVLLIAYLWWPNENNERYAYSIQLQQQDKDEQELDKVITSSSESVNPDIKLELSKEKKDEYDSSVSDEENDHLY